MKNNARKCYNELKKLGCPVKEWYDDSRGHFWIDAEDPKAYEWLDYWNMNLNFGSDKLNEILEKHDLYWEWYNSAYGHVYDN
jgi:hypothetical protein